MDPQTVDIVIKIIKEVGFPVGVAAYLLIVQSKIIRENTKAIQDLIAYLREKRS